MWKNLIFIISILFVLSITHCARRGTPTGGPKDTIPPVLINASPPLNTTMFNEEKISLSFDEYIQLTDIENQLIISPPLEPKQYSISPKGVVAKKIVVKLLDTLKPNITYTFNFGSSIVDYNEGNVLNFFSYTFSTGALIDSLRLEGVVKNAYEQEADRFVSIHLYPVDSIFSDSTIFKEKPFYIANTADSTYFKIENISPGTYEMIAIKDVGKNYLFDQNIDKIGFFDEHIELPRDSIKFPVLFKEIPNFSWAIPKILTNRHVVFGYFGDPSEKTIELISEVPEDFKYMITKHTEKDSLDFWLSGLEKIDSLVFNLQGKDSIERRVVKPTRIKKDSLELEFSKKGSIDLLDSLFLYSSLPIITLNDSLIEITDIDTIAVPFASQISPNFNKIILDFEKLPNDNYTVNVFPNAVIDFWGDANKDTLSIKLSTKKIEDYGVIILSIEKEEDFNYFIELIDEQLNVVRKAFKAEGERYTFNYLNPAKYKIRLIKDINENGKWDTGNYLKKIQPEEIIYMEGEIELRANWDQNETFIIK